MRVNALVIAARHVSINFFPFHHVLSSSVDLQLIFKSPHNCLFVLRGFSCCCSSPAFAVSDV